MPLPSILDPGSKRNFEMKAIPKEIKAAGPQIQIQWSDGHASRYNGRDLRLACRCAACVDEWTHQSLINASGVPSDLKPLTIDVVGNYALHFGWSDGHTTGIYSYDYLREICACDICKSKRSFAV